MPTPIPGSYAAVSPPARVVAGAIGALAPMPLGVVRVRKVLSSANVTVAGYRLSDQQIRAAIKELEAADIVVREHDGVRAMPGWELFLTRATHQAHSLAAIVRAFFQTGPRSYWDGSEDAMLMRTHVVLGDFAALDELIRRRGPRQGSWWFLANPLAVDLLEQLPPGHREHALADCLGYAIDAAAPPEPVIDACLDLSGELSRHAADIAFLRILQGRFDDAAKVFSALPTQEREARAAATGLAATQALLAVLRGDDAEARAHLEATLAAEKRGTRKRIVFPDSRAFTLALLSPVRTNTPESIHLLQQLLKSADRREVQRPAELRLVRNALAAQREEVVYHARQTFPCLELLFDALAFSWRGSARLSEPEWREALATYRDQAVAGGHDWAAAECDGLLRRAGMHGQSAEIPPEDLHARLGIVSLTNLAAPAPEWERTLRALEQHAYDTTGKATRKAVTEAERRLVWEVHEDYESVELRPREQRRNKNGSWSKGRKVALKRLAREAADLPFLRTEDRAAAAAITVTREWYGDDHYDLGPEGLYALAGHPHVFDAEGTTLDIVRREPELRLEEDAEWVTATVEPRELDLDDGTHYAYYIHGGRCEVTHFTPARRRLLEIVPPEGVKLPLAARSRLLEAVSALASEVRVHGGIDDDGPGAAQVEADPAPWVRLEPLEAGLKAALAVEPVPESGLCFEPGAGGVTVFAVRDGESVRARRDLDAERRAVASLLEHCPALAPQPTEREPLLLPEPVDCLEFLDQIQNAGARCKWPRGEPLRIVARASARSLALTVKSAAEWLQASGELKVDEERRLDLQRLFALLEAHPGSRFLELAPGEFLALTATFRRQLEDFASLAATTRGGATTLHPLGALALDDLLEEADLSADRQWRERRARLAAAESFEPELPSTLQAELRPYQLDGFRWLSRLSRWGAGACLADDMGLGKTVQTLALLVERAPDGPALVVAPTSVVANWAEEARRFAPTLRVRSLVGTAGSRARLLEEPAPFDLYLTTYGVLQNDIDALAEVPWHSAVLDEAQAIKNPTAKRARAARRLRADFRLVTTGTPIQNNLMDLHSLFAFTNPGLLGSTERFRHHFGLPIERDGDEDARARLRRVIAPFVLRRLKSEVIEDLPERTEIALHVEMSAAETALYETIRQRAVAELDSPAPQEGDGQRRIRILAHLTRLRLACCNPRLVLDAGISAPGSSKLATFAATLDELLANRHKVLVFSQFVTHLKLVEEYLRGAGVAYQYLDGATPAKSRAERIAAFQAGAGDVFLISLKAGGVGLNLTAADYVIHMDPWWNPAVEDQASDRAHRIGQTRPVTIYRLITKGTVEEQIVDLHHRKRDLADRLLEGADASARLDPNALLALLRQPPAMD